MVKVIRLSSGITLGGKATACMLHVHYATLVTYANPHPQFMFEPNTTWILIYRGTRGHKFSCRVRCLFLAARNGVIASQRMIQLMTIFLLLIASFCTTKRSQALSCCTLLDWLVLYSCEFSASIHATVRCTSINFVRLTENLWGFTCLQTCQTCQTLYTS